MLELKLDDESILQAQMDGTLRVQDEPALEIALPQVFTQPPLTLLQRGKLANAEALVARLLRRLQEEPDAALGLDYQLLVGEFQPLFAWTTACWDYLLSTEGCRFIPRQGESRLGIRGDYRAVTYQDYSRMVHAVFRETVFEFARQPAAPSLSQWLRQRLWPLILEAYRKLENPSDPRQRTLTAYSYLRCVPYQFLDDFHHELVHTTLLRLPEPEQRAIEVYFLRFHTETASAESLGCSVEELRLTMRQALVKLLLHDRLVYCLLRQIERY